MYQNTYKSFDKIHTSHLTNACNALWKLFQESKRGCMKQPFVFGLLPLPKSLTSHFALFFCHCDQPTWPPSVNFVALQDLVMIGDSGASWSAAILRCNDIDRVPAATGGHQGGSCLPRIQMSLWSISSQSTRPGQNVSQAKGICLALITTTVWHHWRCYITLWNVMYHSGYAI